MHNAEDDSMPMSEKDLAEPEKAGHVFPSPSTTAGETQPSPPPVRPENDVGPLEIPEGKKDPALELALLERIDGITNSGGEEIRKQDNREDFGPLCEMKRDGLIDVENPDAETLVVNGLTEKGRRRLDELREQRIRPW